MRSSIVFGVAAALLVGLAPASAIPTRQMASAVARLRPDVTRDVTIKARRYEFTPAHVEVREGDLVKITLETDDIPHSLTIDDYRISKRVLPGQRVVIEFRADRPGSYPYYCSLTAEDGCRKMKGELVVR